MKTILIPHLHYKVFIKKPTKEKPFENAVAWVESNGFYSCTLYINQPIKQKDIPTLAHELVHVLQFIALERNIDFKLEHEHFGYLMNYMMNIILGYEYE